MDGCDVDFDDRTGCVTMAWRSFTSSAQFRADNERVLGALVARRAACLLGEIEALGRIPEADQRWLSDDWIPRAIRHGLRRVALVTPAFDLDHGPVLLVGEKVAASLELAYFDDVAAAMVWLRSLQPA